MVNDGSRDGGESAAGDGMAERPLVLLVAAHAWPAPLLDSLGARLRLQTAASAPEVVARIRDRRPRLLLLGPDLTALSTVELCRKIRGDPKLRQLSIAAVRTDAGTQAATWLGAPVTPPAHDLVRAEALEWAWEQVRAARATRSAS